MESNENPYSGAEDVTNMKIVVEMIDKIVQTLPVKTGDTGKFHIYMKNEGTTTPLVLTGAQLLEGPGKFSTLFFVYFGKILYAEKKEWPKFVVFVSNSAIKGELEETDAMIAANNLFEHIAHEIKVSKDKTELLKFKMCNRLVEHTPHDKKWFVMPSSAITEFISELPIKASQSDISQAMTLCGFKDKDNGSVKVKTMPIKCWWFSVEKILEINPDIEVLQ